MLAAAAVVALLSTRNAAWWPAARSIDARPFSPPRTPWGDPDLQGAYTNNDERNTPMERPSGLEGRRPNGITPAELARLNQERARHFHAFERRWEPEIEPPPHNSRPWLIVDPADGKIPPVTPDVARRAAMRTAASRQLSLDAPWLSLGLFERCVTRGLPESMLPAMYGNVYEILQSPGIVAIRYEMVNEARVIPLDSRPHVSGGIRSYMGDARGHFDGDSLVVETTNFTDRTPYRGSSRDLRLIERFMPLAADAMEWSVTLEDPATWAQPWTFAMELARTTERPLEFACHEGNYALRHVLSVPR